jgi:hypothetical protein
MVDSRRPHSVEVEELLRNVELRNELERFYDESITRVNVQHLPLSAENEFLASMLAWEEAPVLPIYRWFEPELRPPNPSALDDDNLSTLLIDLIEKLYEKRIVLDFTDHLTNRELFCLICRNILPVREKKLDLARNYLHWDCSGDTETWLRFYAKEQERQSWSESYHLPLPAPKTPPYPRNLPRETREA